MSEVWYVLTGMMLMLAIQAAVVSICVAIKGFRE